MPTVWSRGRGGYIYWAHSYTDAYTYTCVNTHVYADTELVHWAWNADKVPTHSLDSGRGRTHVVNQPKPLGRYIHRHIYIYIC